MLKIVLDIPAMSKPRGNLSFKGKRPHIYHDTPEYRAWIKRFTREITALPLQSKHFDDLYSIVFHIYYKPGKGRYPDGDNLQGAIQDTLVKLKYLSDDSIAIINDWKGKAFISDHDAIAIYLCYNKNDLIRVITEYE